MFDEKMEETFRKNYPQYCRGKELLSPYWDLWQAGAEYGYNEALKEVDGICTEEAIYHARLEELFDRINWDGLEVKESEDEKLLIDTALCIEKAIDNAEDNKWHFVKNGDLPEDFKDVLILDTHKNCMVGQRNSTAEENYAWEVPEDFMPDKEVIAWKKIELPKIAEE
jgi:hypothetical protein